MLLSKKIFRLCFLFVLAMAIFTSCSKDDEIGKEIKTTNTTTTPANPGSTDKNATQRVMNTDEDSLCFAFVYPLTIDLPDNGFVLLNNEEGLISFIEQWERDNPDATDYPSLRFPIRVIVDGATQRIGSEDELVELVEYCFNEWEENESDDEVEEFCFDFVYPITILFPEGNSLTVHDFETLFTAINDWYEANEDNNEDVTLAYPVEIIMDGTRITLNNDEELEDAFDACEYAFDECFTINYPITIRIDSTNHIVNNTHELATLIESYEENNPGGNDIEIIFPLSVTMNDGEVVTINNEDELDAIFEECYDEDCRATNLILASPKNAAEQVVSGMRFFGS